MVNIGHNRCSHPAHGRHRRTAVLCLLLLLSSTAEAARNLASPGRPTSAGCLGTMPTSTALSKNGPISITFRSKWCIWGATATRYGAMPQEIRWLHHDQYGCPDTARGAGVDSTALIIGDFSNGNDGIVLKGKQQLNELAGHSIHLVEGNVSHYLLARRCRSRGWRRVTFTPSTCQMTS